MNDLDRKNLLLALNLATQAIGVSDPNPRVGCVIGDASGRVFATGSTQQVGGPHAEAAALLAACAAGFDLRGATAWVTLEPCAHHGRTPPCCDALIDAGITRVVAALIDPFPAVAGSGFDRLRAAGVQVDMADSDSATQARELNIGYFSRIERQRPWVRLKIAASLDGQTALQNGDSQWITGEAARTDGHVWRKRASAILTGIGTVLRDDPRLDVRLVPTRLQPTRMVLDSALRIPISARILDGPGACLVFAVTGEPKKGLALQERGAEVCLLAGKDGKVDLQALMVDLARRSVNELHVEAGSQLNGALLRAGLVDELLAYLAPKLIGSGRGMAQLEPLASVSECLEMRFVETRRIGPDVFLRARVGNFN